MTTWPPEAVHEGLCAQAVHKDMDHWAPGGRAHGPLGSLEAVHKDRWAQ
jgi:hypothetical protein